MELSKLEQYALANPRDGEAAMILAAVVRQLQDELAQQDVKVAVLQGKIVKLRKGIWP